MPTLDTIAALAPLFDVLALAACVMLLCFLVLNRLKYGRLYLVHPGTAGKGAFAREVSMQVMAQQSRKVHDNLQRALTREFASLCSVDGACAAVSSTATGDERAANSTGGGSGAKRRQYYGRANDMLGRGTDAATILRQCRIAESELALLQGLQQFAEEGSSER